MKNVKVFVIIAITSLALSLSAQGQTIKVGGGAELRSDPPVGLITKITYNLGLLDPNLRISLDAAIVPSFEGNLDLHYSFVREFGFDAYAIGGANFGTTIGGNAGVGVNIELSDALDGFGEVKYLINNSPQASIKIGLLYKL